MANRRGTLGVIPYPDSSKTRHRAWIETIQFSGGGIMAQCFLHLKTPFRMTMRLLLCALLLLPTGCQTTTIVQQVAAPINPNFFSVGQSVQGRQIECQVLGEGPDTAFIIASIHGDETAGSPLVRRLSDHLQANPHRLIGRRVILLPAINPDGMAHSIRENANGIDLNRNFPAANRENNERYGFTELSEPEAQIIAMLVELYAPSRVIAIHQPLACVDYDGPAQALAARMAQLTKLPVKKLGTRPGSLGAFLGEELGIPTITLELPRGVDKWNETKLWEAYGDALVAAVVFPDAVQAELVNTQPPQKPVRSMGKASESLQGK